MVLLPVYVGLCSMKISGDDVTLVGMVAWVAEKGAPCESQT